MSYLGYAIVCAIAVGIMGLPAFLDWLVRWVRHDSRRIYPVVTITTAMVVSGCAACAVLVYRGYG